MPDGYEITPERLTTAYSQVIDTKSNLDRQLQAIESEVQSVSSSWSGDAAKAFQALMVRFHDDSNKINKALDDIAERLKAAGASYHHQEQQHHESMSQLANRLNAG